MFFRRSFAIILMFSGVSASGLPIVLNAGAGLAGNAPALAAFQRAANTWGSMFSDNFTVNIDADMAVLGNPSIIGQASSLILGASYDTIRNAVVNDAANEPSNGIVASLPTAAQFNATLPAGFALDGRLQMTQANANALGFNVNFGADGNITFNSTFAFDYDNSNGVGGGLIDFETVALHEIGHVLGFYSEVDYIDFLMANNSTDNVIPTTLDLFRFVAGLAPVNAAEFTANARNYVPGAAAVFSDTVNTWAFSTGFYTGDGRQASHWKDDSLTGSLIGVMDPTLSTGFISLATAADRRAFDLIGYDLNEIPEPSAFVLVGAGLATLAFLRKRRS